MGNYQTGIFGRFFIMMIMIREVSLLAVVAFFPNHPPVMDAGERPQIRDEHAVVLLLGAGEVGEATEPLRAEAETKEGEKNT